MNDTTSSPSRLLKITAVTARWLLGLLVTAWLLFALSVAVLHGWIVPRIGDYRGALEAQATRVIGVPVRIGALTAQSAGLFPTLELRDVVLLDPQQREALRLARVVASVSPRSLWRLSFEQLYVERPQLEVRRDRQGRLHVAGLHMPTETSSGNGGVDWLFSQREFVIEGGTVRWVDELRAAAPLLLSEVRFVARNSGRRHALRLDATPPPGWGERLTLRGRFRQPLLSVRRGNWQTWDGELYAELPQIDVSRLGRYVALSGKVREGNGALRVWADVRHGQASGGVADLALARVDVSLGEKLAPLALRAVTGRLAGKRTGETLEFSTTQLQFDKADGSHWPGGNLWFQHTPQAGQRPERSALRADRLDLAALAQIASRLPLGQASHDALAAYAPSGLVERIDASWQGPLEAAQAYQARGRVSALQVAAQPALEKPVPWQPGAPHQAPPIGTPGLRGATIDFEASHTGGKASVSLAQGALELPGVFEDPVVPIDQLSTQVQWQIQGPKLQLQLKNLRFANADAQGEAQADWRTSDPATSPAHDRFPGVLDLQGRLTRADGTRVFRYLPLHIPKPTRDYVRDGVLKGKASSVDFRVRGDLHDMPFMDPRQGDFRIAAKVADVTFNYVPHEAGASRTAPPVPAHWPVLSGLSGELVFERAGMQVRNARGRVVGAPGIEVNKAEARIADMSHHAPVLQVEAQAQGPLAAVLQVAAPIAGDATAWLQDARASGRADYSLKLELPLEALDQAKVQASIALGGNELQLVPGAPAFTQARGVLNFTERGFALAGVQARLAGGEVRLEGQGRYGAAPAGKVNPADPELHFTAQGTMTADGLRNAREVAWLARLARKATGSTPYTASFSLRDGTPEFSFNSSLQGLALDLPAPLAKSATASLPLHIEKKVVLRETRAGTAPPTVHDRLSLDVGRLAAAHYVRDLSSGEARVLRGALAVGLAPGESAVAPDQGVLANLNLARFDFDAWQALLRDTTGAAPGAPAAASADHAGTSAADDLQAYLPSIVALRAQSLSVAGRTLQDVVVGGSREGTLWRANIDARQLNGYAEYRQAQGAAGGRVYARLARLQIEPSAASQVESLLDEAPATLPALDIVVEDFELLGKHLGRAEIDAVNRGGPTREWRLNKLAFRMPEASFEAKGGWSVPPGARGEGGATPGGRRMALDFRLDMSDAGALLTRLGMPGVVRRGRGHMAGEVAWRGSPFALDYPSLRGQLNLNVEQGQFLKAEPGLAKLLSVLSLQALPRRFTLDFRDVFSQGFAFDFLRGDATIAAGTASTNNLQMKGVNAAVLMDGSANLAQETQQLRVVIVPEIDAGTAALVATAINPVVGVAAFVAQMVLRQPLIAAATQEFQVDGSWSEPKITKMPRRKVPAATARSGPAEENKP